MTRRLVGRIAIAAALLIAGAVAADMLWRSDAGPAPPPVVSAADAEEQLAARALVRRDEYGVPHIEADTEEAAALAHGYVSAEDHGALMARGFLRARGLEASIFGAAFAESDIRIHTLRIPEIAAERFRELPPFMQAIVNGYATGYNRYLKRRRADMPAWATPITGVDVLAHCRALMLLDFALDPKPLNVTRTASASTMWAIAPALSQSRHAMLMANPHLAWAGPALFHEVHITVPGVINVSGATFVGGPVVSIGFNDVLGWAHTVNAFDADDVYRLTLDASHTHYKYDDRWLELKPYSFDIEVKTDRGLQKSHHTALWSHYGPIVRIKGNEGYAFKSPNLDAVNFLTQYNAMAKATSLQTFIAALNMQQLPTFNITYADKAGNIWYLFNGRIPIRPAGPDWAGTVAGDTSRTEWFTVYPVGELPQLLNPKSGYVQNSNDAPWYANLAQRIDATSIAKYLPRDDVTWRGQASLKFLSGVKPLTLEQLMAYKFDSRVLIADRVKSELLAALAAGGDRWRDAARVLEKWDNTLEPGSRGAVLFAIWWNDYSRAVAPPFRTPWSAAHPIETPSGLADRAQALEAFGRAVEMLKSGNVPLDVAWGDVHRARRGTLDLPLGGSDSTLRNVKYTSGADGKEVAIAGDTYVLAVEFGPSPRAYSVTTYSQASNTQSPYFNNQLALYAGKRLKRAWFSPKDVDAHTKRRYRPGEP